MRIRFKKVDEKAIEPKRGSDYAAGLDLYACLKGDLTKIAIKPNETKIITSGISMEIPEGYFGAIYARSGLATKKGLRPANCVGIVDSDYRGEIGIPVHYDGKDGDEVRYIEHGDRIAQIVIQPYLDVTLEETGVLNDTNRGDCGFGSTGLK